MIATSISFFSSSRTMISRLFTDRDARTPGIAPLEMRDQRGREVLGRADDADADAPAGEPLQRRDRRVRILQRIENLPRVAQQLAAGLGQDQLLAPALEQRDPGDLLQPLDLQRHRRLGQMQLLGRAHEAQVPRRGDEYLQLPDGDAAHRDTVTLT